MYDPERCFDYPLQLDLDLERDLGDMETFDVDDRKRLTQNIHTHSGWTLWTGFPCPLSRGSNLLVLVCVWGGGFRSVNT